MEIALDALAAAKDWAGADEAVKRLAAELEASPQEVAAEVQRRRK